MLHEKSCLIINMPKIMIINYQQFAKTNTFSLSFHILFSPFLHIFPQDTSKSGFGVGQKWAKMGLDPPNELVEYGIKYIIYNMLYIIPLIISLNVYIL